MLQDYQDNIGYIIRADAKEHATPARKKKDLAPGCSAKKPPAVLGDSLGWVPPHFHYGLDQVETGLDIQWQFWPENRVEDLWMNKEVKSLFVQPWNVLKLSTWKLILLETDALKLIFDVPI